ncbi:hypothetical protein SNEBB_004636 [Seison nebaliae]|nr:hypothetical protein SNEBB_004636 [Seison nebaliae]
MEMKLVSHSDISPHRLEDQVDRRMEEEIIAKEIHLVLSNLVDRCVSEESQKEENQSDPQSHAELRNKLYELERRNETLSDENINHLVTIESLSNRLTAFEKVSEMFPDIHNSITTVLDGEIENESERRLLEIAKSRLDYVDAKISNDTEVINQDIVPKLIQELTIAITMNSSQSSSVQETELLRELA